MKLEELGELRLDRLDISLLFSNFRKFVDYAESNLEWQHRSQIQKLLTQANKDKQTPPEYYHQAETSLNEDYEFVIPNAVRYSSLVMLVTFIEWFIKFCEKYSDERGWIAPPVSKKKTLRKIEWLRGLQAENFSHPFEDKVAALIELRNCIVHDAAIVNNDIQKNAVQSLDGVRLGEFLYMTNLIVFDKGTIERLSSETEEWIDSFLDYLKIGDRIPHELITE